MIVLVSGASGLVGGRLVRHLLESGDVRIRTTSRTPRSWPRDVESYVVDYNAPETLIAPCQDVDAVVNLASMPERACRLDPAGALRVNAGGTLALAMAAAGAGVKRFVQLSTSKVYGNDPQGIVTEETPCQPQSHYAITHRAAEDYARSQHRNSVVFRLANGFGAPVDRTVDCWDIVANDFCRQAVVDRHIRVRSSGRAWRNFVPLSDIVTALHVATSSTPSGTYNLGSRESMSLRDLAARVTQVCQEVLGFSPESTFGPAAAGESHEPLDYRIDKLTAAGSEPGASLDGELRETLLTAQRWFGK